LKSERSRITRDEVYVGPEPNALPSPARRRSIAHTAKLERPQINAPGKAWPAERKAAAMFFDAVKGNRPASGLVVPMVKSLK